jgi:hypothetical protein
VFSEHLGGQPERRRWGVKITTRTINFPWLLKIARLILSLTIYVDINDQQSIAAVELNELKIKHYCQKRRNN